MKKMVLLAALVLASLLGACVPVPALAPAFPTGKFNWPLTSRALQFNQDGTYAALSGTVPLAWGVYSVKGDVFTIESDSDGCLAPRHYRYTFDGSKLVFYPLEDPTEDSCDARKGDFSDLPNWVMAK